VILIIIVVIIINKVIYCPTYYKPEWPGITESIKKRKVLK